MKTTNILALALLALFATSLGNLANSQVLNGYGMHASVATASNCPSFCTTANGGQFSRDSDGSEFAASAFAEDTAFGIGRAEASVSGSAFLPNLRAIGSSAVGKSGEGSSFGVQGYGYSGAATKTIDLDINLHATVTDGASGYTANSAGASVAVLKGSTLGWSTDFGTLVFEIAGETTSELGLENLSLNAASISNDDSATISFSIDPGDNFFVVASLRARAKNGSADAWNTLTLDFDDDTGLTPTLVPEPRCCWIAAMATLLLAFRRRASRTSV